MILDAIHDTPLDMFCSKSDYQFLWHTLNSCFLRFFGFHGKLLSSLSSHPGELFLLALSFYH